MLTRAAPAALAVLTLLSACADRPDPAPIVFRGSTPAPGTPVAAPSPAPAPAPAPAVAAPAAPVQVARLPEPADLAPTPAGVVDYGGYSAIRARAGDTVESIAARVGLSPAALASYNGLPADWRPEAGDELILPPREGGYARAAAPAPVRVAAAAPAPTPAPAPAPAPATDLDLERIEQDLAAPVSAPAPAAEPAAPAAQPERVAAATPAPAPATPAPAASARFIRPVEGEVLRSFNPAPGPNRSSGIDFAAAPGSPVVAAAEGRVALITEPVGVDGAIVMIDHGDDLLAIYGRLEDIAVSKGDTVRQGQTLGRVAPADASAQPYLQFEVIRGTESVDPADLLG